MPTNNTANSILKKQIYLSNPKTTHFDINQTFNGLADSLYPFAQYNIIIPSESRSKEQGGQRSVNSRGGSRRDGVNSRGKMTDKNHLCTDNEWAIRLCVFWLESALFASACAQSGVLVCVRVSVAPAPEETATFGPVMRPRRLVWSEKPVQICTAALCTSHSIRRPWVKGKRAGRSHLTAPLSCLWWWGRNKNGGTFCPWGQARSIALWCVSAPGDSHHSRTK